MMMPNTAIRLADLTQRLSAVLNSARNLQNLWITAETADVQLKGGHCYLDLVDKDPATGRQVAKMRATIWASAYYRLAAKFAYETQQQLRSDMKVMVLVSVNFHPVFGLSLNIQDIDGSYTLGDVMQRRNQILQRLQAEGVINCNRELPWPRIPQRIAIISAEGAAGYGDFMHQLYHNPSRLRFVTRLFSASMQGERTAPTIIAALEQIGSELDEWDCVVIIRGGGASTDLLAFDDYDLAANIANFPLPVVIGIGHERDITVLDYVANMRVKTPTAAAEWLIDRGERELDHLHSIASDMLRAVTDRLSGCHQQLAYFKGLLPAATSNALNQARSRVKNASMSLSAICDRRINPEKIRLDNYQSALRQALSVQLSRARQRLDADERLVEVLSPQATLRRGYSITMVGGHALKSAAEASPGDIIETVFADGKLQSTVKRYNKK